MFDQKTERHLQLYSQQHPPPVFDTVTSPAQVEPPSCCRPWVLDRNSRDEARAAVESAVGALPGPTPRPNTLAFLPPPAGFSFGKCGEDLKHRYLRNDVAGCTRDIACLRVYCRQNPMLYCPLLLSDEHACGGAPCDRRRVWSG